MALLQKLNNKQKILKDMLINNYSIHFIYDLVLLVKKKKHSHNLFCSGFFLVGNEFKHFQKHGCLFTDEIEKYMGASS